MNKLRTSARSGGVIFVILACIAVFLVAPSPDAYAQETASIEVHVAAEALAKVQEKAERYGATVLSTLDPHVFSIEWQVDASLSERDQARFERRLTRKIDRIEGVSWAIPASTQIEAFPFFAWPFFAWPEGQPDPDANAIDLAEYYSLDVVHQQVTGAGITVAVLDNGFDLSHPQIAAQTLVGVDLVDEDYDVSPVADGLDGDNDGLIDEALDHGTQVASILAQVAPGAQILPIRVLDSEGTGELNDVVQGIDWAVAQGADVINISFGTPDNEPLLQAAIARAYAANIVIVAASGNSNSNSEVYPAAYSQVQAVGAADPLTGELAIFSNYGSWVDVAAPGQFVRGAGPAYGEAALSGSSIATPVVAGQHALILSDGLLQIPAASAKERVRSTATGKAGTTRDTAHGPIDIAASVDSDGSLLRLVNDFALIPAGDAVSQALQSPINAGLAAPAPVLPAAPAPAPVLAAPAPVVPADPAALVAPLVDPLVPVPAVVAPVLPNISIPGVDDVAGLPSTDGIIPALPIFDLFSIFG